MQRIWSSAEGEGSGPLGDALNIIYRDASRGRWPESSLSTFVCRYRVPGGFAFSVWIDPLFKMEMPGSGSPAPAMFWGCAAGTDQQLLLCGSLSPCFDPCPSLTPSHRAIPLKPDQMFVPELGSQRYQMKRGV